MRVFEGVRHKLVDGQTARNRRIQIQRYDIGLDGQLDVPVRILAHDLAHQLPQVAAQINIGH